MGGRGRQRRRSPAGSPGPTCSSSAGLFHDIGKGGPGDHTEIGIAMLADIGPRMGLDADDAAVLVALCRHHLLLPDVATRRDLDDPATIDAVAAAVGDREMLELLAALTEADSLATGPAAWSDWKAGLVRALVARVDHVLGGGHAVDVADEFPTPSSGAAGRGRADAAGRGRPPDRRRRRPARPVQPGGRRAVAPRARRPRRRGRRRGRMGLEVFRVQSSFGPTITWDRVMADLEAALAGRLAIRARLADRVRTYGVRRGPPVADEVEPEVRVDLDASPVATVVEVHARDGLGVLYRITRALADLDLDIVSAKVQTLGAEVVDSFYVRSGDGAEAHRPGRAGRGRARLAARPRPGLTFPGGRAGRPQCSWWHWRPNSSTPANQPHSVRSRHTWIIGGVGST